MHPATRHRSYRPFPNQEYRNLLQNTLEVPLLVRLLALPSGKRVLEIGCGRGVALPPLARLCTPTRLVGLDIAPDLLMDASARARHGAVSVELCQADVTTMPFEDASFDMVVDFGTCYHVARPDLAIREIARVLDTGGLFVHETPLSQRLAHPVRSSGRALPWDRAGRLAPFRSAVLWAARRKV